MIHKFNTLSQFLKFFPEIFFYIFTYIRGYLLFTQKYISQFSKIFTRNFFYPIYIKLGIVPPIYDKYDILGGGGIPP